jgi:hypothetical protein
MLSSGIPVIGLRDGFAKTGHDEIIAAVFGNEMRATGTN